MRINSDSYEKVVPFTIELRGRKIHFFSKPGLPNWNLVPPSAYLLANHVNLINCNRWLFLGCGHGAVAASLAHDFPFSEGWITDISIIALQVAEQTLRNNQIDNVKPMNLLDFDPSKHNSLDKVLIDLPKGRHLTRRWLLEAYNYLRTGGDLYLAGPNNLGVQSAIKDAETLFGAANILAYKKGNRLARFTKPPKINQEVGWHSQPGIVPKTWHEISIESKYGKKFFKTLPGVFSFEKLDEGTGLLLSHLEVSRSHRILDLGCGYGVIGICAAFDNPLSVDFVDVNILAIESTLENLHLHAIQGAQVYPSDVMNAVKEKRYHLILSNPPFHAGREVDNLVAQAFIEQSWQALESNGKMLLVENQFRNYEKLLRSRFQNVTCIAKTSAYHLLVATRY